MELRNNRRLIVISVDYCGRDLYRKLKLPFNYNLLRAQFRAVLINGTADGCATIDDDEHERNYCAKTPQIDSKLRVNHVHSMGTKEPFL